MQIWPHRSTCQRLFAMLAVAVLILVSTVPATGQDPADPLNKILTDPEKREEQKKEKLRPPIEFFRSQVLPNDVLPYIKANHWTMVGLEMRANHEDFNGSLQTSPVTLADQPHDMIYRRDAILIKGQNSRLTMPILLPIIPKELNFQLIRPEALRGDDWAARLSVLEPHQQLIVVLSKTANDHFVRWSQYRAALPWTARRDDPQVLEKVRYYRFVLPLDPEKPMLSPHPLTWSPISHVIWDGLSPETLGDAQQKAMIDWLHWGGQLIVVGGAGPAFAPLRESFLAPYLPAEPSGENALRSGEQLKPLWEEYLPPANARDPDEPIAQNSPEKELFDAYGRRYKDPAPIRATDKKPIFITSLVPRPGATVIPLGGPGDPPLGVEWKVGRGRVLMVGVSLSDPDLMGWPGFDTLVRRVVLRRPEEKLLSPMGRDSNNLFVPPRYEVLNGLDLTTVRYFSRDLEAPRRKVLDEDGTLPSTKTVTINIRTGLEPATPEPLTETPVGEWLDSSALPILCRDTLEKASGIEIPSRGFVLKVILGYIFVLVPLNYAICRYLLRRREWAWVLVPTLSFAFAVGVERAAAYDVGYDSSCDEVDLIETHGDYPRGHLSRFASLYSTGRVKFSISYPKDSTALALPLATGRALRGEDSTLSTFQTQPIPVLGGFQVQPRSLSMFRAEQMANLPGTVSLSAPGDGPKSIVNNSGLDLKDVWVVDVQKDRNEVRGLFLGEIAAGARISLGQLEKIYPDETPTPGSPDQVQGKTVVDRRETGAKRADNVKASAGSEQLDPQPFLQLLLRQSVTTRPEEVGELRLIAWANKPVDGQVIDPPVDRQRGFTLMVAHLEPSPLLSPDSPRYNLSSRTPEGRASVPPIFVPGEKGRESREKSILAGAETRASSAPGFMDAPALVSGDLPSRRESPGSSANPTPTASESFRP